MCWLCRLQAPLSSLMTDGASKARSDLPLPPAGQSNAALSEEILIINENGYADGQANR